MKIILTVHAKERMTVRKITEKMVREALVRPDKKGFGYQNRLLVFKSFNTGSIKVVYSKERDFYIIISVIWESLNKIK